MGQAARIHIWRPDGRGDTFCDGPASIIFHPRVAASLGYGALCPICAARFAQYRIEQDQVKAQIASEIELEVLQHNF